MSKEEVRAALRRMNCEKAVGQDGIPLEVWRCLGNSAHERMPYERRKSVPVHW